MAHFFLPLYWREKCAFLFAWPGTVRRRTWGCLQPRSRLALFVSYIFGPQINDYAYDSMFRAYRPPKPAQPESVVLAIDELTLMDCGGIRGIRRPIARALSLLAPVKPKAVAVDVILADRGDPAEDAALAEAFRATPNLVLSTELIDGGRIWEDPRPEFATGARLGHVSTLMDKDGVTRSILIDQHNDRVQRRALALEAFLLSRGVDTPRESLTFTRFRGGLVSAEIQVGDVTIPVLEDRREHRRLMRVRFFPPDLTVPRVSMKRLLDDPSLAAQFAGKVVFVGVTANSEIHDRLFTPFGMTPGTEINAAAFETMAQGMFLTDVGTLWENLIALALLVAIGLAFRYLPGWWAYGAGGLLLLGATLIPYVFFLNQRVFPFATSFLVAWLGTLTAASYYHLVVRRNLQHRAGVARTLPAGHALCHSRDAHAAFGHPGLERTDLALPADRGEAQADRPVDQLRIQAPGAHGGDLSQCGAAFRRADGTEAGGHFGEADDGGLRGARAPARRAQAHRHHAGAGTRRSHSYRRPRTGGVRLLQSTYQRGEVFTPAYRGNRLRPEGRLLDSYRVKDQGIGMDQKEVKQIFQKFYRTKKAEESGEAGTGIGLSIVQQIVEQHGGRIEVTSRPGAGSCFTVVMAARAAAGVSTAAERH